VVTTAGTTNAGLLAGEEVATAGPAQHHRTRRRRTLLPYLLVSPFLAYESLFVFYPIVRGVILAFQSTNFGKTSFVGFSNFDQMVHDPVFWASVQTTAEFTLSMVAIWLCFGLAMALLMNWTFHGRAVVRAALALPWAMPDVPTVLTFTIMLDPNFGVLNRIAGWLPTVHSHIAWLTTPNLAFISILGIVGWKGFPFFGLIILSSLQSIPEDLYEAARVDGAGALRRFRAITLPSIKPTLALLAVLAFIFSFQQFTLIYVSTGGGPGTATQTLALLIYNEAFTFFNYNYAAAIGVVGLLAALVGTVIFIAFQRRVTRQQLDDLGVPAL
jgi:multiple sugar transport system permease protein